MKKKFTMNFVFSCIYYPEINAPAMEITGCNPGVCFTNNYFCEVFESTFLVEGTHFCKQVLCF